MIYLWLFRTNLFISSFTFGGGYVVVPMIRRYFVLQKQLFCEEELLDMSAIAQSSPGAIAVNLAVLAGWRTAGLPGALISALGALMPPVLILSLISLWYEAFAANAVIAAILKGMQAGAAALMTDLVIDMGMAITKRGSRLLTAMVPAAFLLNFVLNVNAALILAASVLICTGRALILGRSNGKKGGLTSP